MKRTVYVLLLMNLVTAFALPGAASAEQEMSTEKEMSVEQGASNEACFSLNGQKYSFSPVLGEFLENGWEMDSVLETFGYSYTKGPYETEEAEAGEWVTYTDTSDENTIVTFDSGFQLFKDEDMVGAYLDQNAVEYGLEPAECPLEHLGVPVGYVDSFIVNGAELANADYSDMVAAFGEPESMEDTGAGVIFSYSLPEFSALISFVFEGASGDEEGLEKLESTETRIDEICLYFGLPTIGDISFSLNGRDYLIYPVIKDFLENGWELGESAEQMGDWSEEEGPYNVVTSGYYLTSGNNRVTVYLDDEQIRVGEDPETCSLRSLSLNGGGAVESLQINGYEIAGVTEEQLTDALGEPKRLLEETYGTTYYYSFPACGITLITVNYSGTGDAQTQISISF